MTGVTSTRRQHGADSTLDGAEVDTVGVPPDQPQSGASLLELAAFFARKPSPIIIGTATLTAAAARVWIGRWSWRDLAVPAIILAAEPFVEWTIHVHLLHRRPTRLGRFTIDTVTARKHRLHHRNPKDLRIVMVPFQALFPAAPIAVGLAAWRLDPPQAAMSLAVGFGMLFTYEWTHYLIHAPYRPKTAWFRRVSRNHRRHHYRNEHYWFGVTNSFGDRVLRTRPEPGDVPLSGTVRTLGLEAPTL
jgi:hypothetical protein